MKAYIYTNFKRDEGGKVTAKISAELSRAGIEVSNILKEADIVFAVGGDGTLLSMAKKCAALKKPVIGVNKGHLGFLTEIDEGGIERAVEAIKSNSYSTEKRFLIEAATADGRYKALNEVVLSHRSYGSVEVRVGGSVADILKGDGVIVSTPTGSTAYSLACGGPVLSPDLNAMVVVGICPHSLHSRPMVVPGGSEITLTPQQKPGVRLIMDGKEVDYSGGAVSVKLSNSYASFIRIEGKSNFYNRLLDKMKYDA